MLNLHVKHGGDDFTGNTFPVTSMKFLEFSTDPNCRNKPTSIALLFITFTPENNSQLNISGRNGNVALYLHYHCESHSCISAYPGFNAVTMFKISNQFHGGRNKGICNGKGRSYGGAQMRAIRAFIPLPSVLYFS